MIIDNIISHTALSGFYVVYVSNALTDRPDERGLSHLLEHLICRQLSPMMDSFTQYAIDFNGITSDDMVVFYIAGLDDYVSPLKNEFFARLMSHPVLEERDLNEERPVILQEYANHFSNPFNAILSNGLRQHYGYYGAMGMKESIIRADLDQLQLLYDERFKTPSRVINVSRSSPFSFHADNLGEGVSCPVSAPVFRIQDDAVLEKIYPNRILLMGMKCCIPNAELGKTQLFHYLLTGDIHKPLLHRLRVEKGLCYSAEMMDYLMGDHHLVFFSTEVDEGYRNLVIDDTFSIIDKACDLIGEDQFNKAVEHFMIKRKMQRESRHNNISDVFYPNLMRDGVLESLTVQSVKDHVKQYYSNPSDIFVLY